MTYSIIKTPKDWKKYAQILTNRVSIGICESIKEVPSSYPVLVISEILNFSGTYRIKNVFLYRDDLKEMF